MRTLLPALVLLACTSASAQSGPPPAAAVLQHARAGGIETPASARAARPARARPASPDVEALGQTPREPTNPARRRAAFQPDARPVVFSVEGDVPMPAGSSQAEAAATLASVLNQDNALIVLSIQTALPSAFSAEFAFESVEAWTEWSSHSLAWQRLGTLGNGLQTRLSVRRDPRSE